MSFEISNRFTHCATVGQVVAAADDSESDTTDSESEPGAEAKLSEASGDSSDDDQTTPAAPSERGHICMFTWPCPRSYLV